MTLEEKRIYNREYYRRNREKMIKTIRDCFSRNKEKYKAQQRKRYQNNKVRLLTETRDYYKNNKDIIKQRREQNKNRYQTQLKRYKSDPIYRFSQNLRNRIKNAIKGNKGLKGINSHQLLGCSIKEVRIYLESQFLEGMSWDNYGLYGWHIDHIRPCNTFDLTDPEQQKQCFHYTNLRPLWAKDNLSRPRDGRDVL